MRILNDIIRRNGVLALDDVNSAIDSCKSIDELADVVDFFSDKSDKIKALTGKIDDIEKELGKKQSAEQIIDAAIKKTHTQSKEYKALIYDEMFIYIRAMRKFKHLGNDDIKLLTEHNLNANVQRYNDFLAGLDTVPKEIPKNPALYEFLFADELEEFEKVGEKIQALVNDIIDSSEFSEQDAEDLYSAVDVQKTAINSIKKAKNYDVTSFKKDCLDVFRLCNGKIKLQKVHHKAKARRAHVIDGQFPEMETGQNLKRSTTWHELGHLIEFRDKSILNKSIALLKKRLKESERTGKHGGGVHLLSDLMGNKGFRRSEVAIDDSFVSYYAGKLYWEKRGNLDSIDATELISTGLEMLSDKVSAARFLKSDPEHFKLVMEAMTRLH